MRLYVCGDRYPFSLQHCDINLESAELLRGALLANNSIKSLESDQL
jgi:hypothetical protein